MQLGCKFGGGVVSVDSAADIQGDEYNQVNSSYIITDTGWSNLQ